MEQKSEVAPPETAAVLSLTSSLKMNLDCRLQGMFQFQNLIRKYI
jgi:hypothetical protein